MPAAAVDVVAAGLAAAAVVLLASVPAAAQGWRGSLALTNDKVQRGTSQSERHTAVMLDASRGTDTGWTLSAGAAAPLYPQRGGDAEITLGLQKALQPDADWLLLMGATHYGVVGAAGARHYRYDELSAAAAWRGRWTASLSLSPNTGRYVGGDARRGRATALEFGWHERLAGSLTLDVGIGRQDFGGLPAPGYTYGSVGLGHAAGPLQLFVTFIDSDARANGAPRAIWAGARWVTTAAWSF